MFRNSTWSQRDTRAIYRHDTPRKRRLAPKVVVLSLLLLAVWQFGAGVYIHAKAHLAQVLIARAWQQSLRTEQPTPPWSWADTWPVAKLNFPRQNYQSYVLAGSTDAIMAFGPGHLVQSAFPGQAGNSVIVGHRDTHFAVLEELEVGHLIEVETQHESRLYRVTNLRIAHQSQVDLIGTVNEPTLTMVTCYPFRSIQANSEHRYIVTAVRIENLP